MIMSRLFTIVVVFFLSVIVSGFAYRHYPSHLNVRTKILPPMQIRSAVKPRNDIKMVGIRTIWGSYCRPVLTTVGQRYTTGCIRFKQNPLSYLTIPICAALVGYVTNWVGVKMLFYPIEWKGIPIVKWPDQPLGLFGWQGIVPAKRLVMSNRLVDVTISRLLNIKDVFNRLEPIEVANMLTPTITNVIFNGLVPSPVLRYFLTKTSTEIIKNMDDILDIKKLVVTSLSTDPTILGNFFQKVAAKELAFLVDSGLIFGFILGIFQMIQWLFFPANWTLPAVGALVGYITNWIALKWIFEPLTPTKYGPFTIQGMFLKRQKDVSKDFCEYLTKDTLTSTKLWESILFEIKSKLKIKSIITKNIPILTEKQIDDIILCLQNNIGKNNIHPIHGYTNRKLELKDTLITAMNRLSPAQFERVLHPIFEEDELTLILSGGVLGALSGFLQIWLNFVLEKWSKRK
eukprot:gene5739-11607_t